MIVFMFIDDGLQRVQHLVSHTNVMFDHHAKEAIYHSTKKLQATQNGLQK